MQKTETDSTPLVSVVMPVYNVEPYLLQAVGSILNQTYRNLELIAVDDGSTDDSGNILDELAKTDARMTVVHQQNQGVVAAANHGIELATGKYIARQDSDDISFLRRIETQVAVLESQPDVELVTGVFEGIDEDDEFIYRDVLPADDEDIKRALYLHNPIGHGSTMIRKTTLLEVGTYGANGDKRGLAEDYELFLRLADKGKFVALETPTYKWRINRKGITSTQNKLMADIMQEHIRRLWQGYCPRVMGTRELRKKGVHYMRTYKKRGVSMKATLLADNAQMGVKMIRFGHPVRGVRQILAVLLVGRSGIRAVRKRIMYLRQGTTDAIRRKIWLGK
jgi:glycosyltransferase involved in cell wall biosynthesis